MIVTICMVSALVIGVLMLSLSVYHSDMAVWVKYLWGGILSMVCGWVLGAVRQIFW